MINQNPSTLVILGYVTCFALQGLATPVADYSPPPSTITKLQPPHDPIILPEPPDEEQDLQRPFTLEPQTGPVYYDHGNPRPIEQMILDRVNRARANPGAEAARLGIDLNEDLDPGTIEDTPKQPLAMNPILISASREHSIWMLENNTFPSDHVGEDGSTVPERIEDAGYEDLTEAAENAAMTGSLGDLDVIQGTANLHDGLFESSGHRVNMMNKDVNETGFGNETGIYTQDGDDYNTLMITHKLASSSSAPSPFVVGTVYYDFSEDGLFYPGEQISDVEITIEDGEYYTLTADAGGYALPLPASTGSKQMTFHHDGLEMEESVLHTDNGNVQQDLILPYEPPEKEGPPFFIQGQEQEYYASDLFGATSFRFYKESHYPAPDDVPTNLSRMDVSTSGDYTPLSDEIHYTGSHAYQLAHPGGASTEILQYNEPFIPGPEGEISFYSRIRWASSDQIAFVDISTNGGLSWEPIYIQAGESGESEPPTETESQFNQRIVSLSDYQGSLVWIRFRYRFEGGDYYPGTSEFHGWFVDNVTFTDVMKREILDSDSVDPGDSYTLSTGSTDTQQLRVRPLHYDNEWPAGATMEIQSYAPITYEDWAAEEETQASLPSGTLANNPDADYSGDGIANLMAYAMDLDPTEPASPEEHPQLAQDGDYIDYVYWTDHRATDIDTELHLSADIETWHTPNDPLSPIEAIDEHLAYDAHREQRRLRIPREDTERVFIRHKVSTK